jgi:predicted nucleotidyltransferase
VTKFTEVLEVLCQGEVHFILIGGVAAVAHGAARLTQDIDLLYSRDPGNLQRIVDSLSPYEPYPRGAPPGLPFLWDAQTLANGANFTLHTTLGEVDLLADIAGGGNYDNLLPHSLAIEVLGVTCQCLGLAQLIKSKRAAGRPKDFEAIAELEIILTESGES